MAGSDPGSGAAADDYGTLYVVGIGPGLPHAMTQRARDVIETADCVIASNLYQEFLRQDGTLPPPARPARRSPLRFRRARPPPRPTLLRRRRIRFSR